MRILPAAFLLASTFLSAFAATPAIPRPAKELTVVEPGGKQTLLSSYRGKVVYIQFLFTTCPHCQALSRELTKVQTELGPKGVQVIGIAFNDEVNPGLVSAYSNQYAGNFPIGYASRDTVMNYLGLSVMDRWVVPQIMIIDKKGVVRAQSDPMGTAQLQDKVYITKFIGDLLKETGAPAAPALKQRPPAATGAAATGKKS